MRYGRTYIVVRINTSSAVAGIITSFESEKTRTNDPECKRGGPYDMESERLDGSGSIGRDWRISQSM